MTFIHKYSRIVQAACTINCLVLRSETFGPCFYLEIFSGGSLPPDLLPGGERRPDHQVIQPVTIQVQTGQGSSEEFSHLVSGQSLTEVRLAIVPTVLVDDVDLASSRGSTSGGSDNPLRFGLVSKPPCGEFCQSLSLSE